VVGVVAILTATAGASWCFTTTVVVAVMWRVVSALVDLTIGPPRRHRQ
jgi:hypothetical protein